MSEFQVGDKVIRVHNGENHRGMQVGDVDTVKHVENGREFDLENFGKEHDPINFELYKPESSVSPSISPKPIVAIHKEDNASEDVYNVRVYYARDLKHLLKQIDNDQESLVDYELFNLGGELELSLREKEL